MRSLLTTARRRAASRGDGGWSLVELMASMAVTAMGLTLIVPVLLTVFNVTNNANSTSNGNAQARVALQQLSADVGSANANNVCFSSSATVVAPFCSSALTSGNTLRALSNVNGSCQWMQWTVSNNELTQQVWPTTWTSASGQPAATPIMGPIVTSGQPSIFSFNATGLVVNIQVTVQGSNGISGVGASSTASNGSLGTTLQSAVSLPNSSQTAGSC